MLRDRQWSPVVRVRDVLRALERVAWALGVIMRGGSAPDVIQLAQTMLVQGPPGSSSVTHGFVGLGEVRGAVAIWPATNTTLPTHHEVAGVCEAASAMHAGHHTRFGVGTGNNSGVASACGAGDTSCVGVFMDSSSGGGSNNSGSFSAGSTTATSADAGAGVESGMRVDMSMDME